MSERRTYRPLGADGRTYDSEQPGTLGAYRRRKIYGRLDCPSALPHIAIGHYVRHRVFFADEATAIDAGYRPCAKCMPDQNALWKSATD
jgi:methylphosphotriester-DNA--protein-cysteine methyltransferase